MRINVQMTRTPQSPLPPLCQVEKVVEVGSGEFDELLRQPQKNRSIITENKDLMRVENGIYHCLLVLGQNQSGGVLTLVDDCGELLCGVLSQARAILRGTVELAADNIIKEGIENTSEGSWCYYFDELYKQMSLVVSADNGIGDMLLEALCRRAEIAEAVLTDDCIDATFYLDYCKNLAASAQPEETDSERRESRLMDEILYYLGDHHDSSELYQMLHGDLGMTHEEIESLGFDLSNCYGKGPAMGPKL